MDTDIFKAVGIDVLGLLAYIGVLTTITSPPFGLSAKQVLATGLIFPTATYVLTYYWYREHFWKAFFGSVIPTGVLLLGWLWLKLAAI